jgi:hypothetical protein
MTKDRQKLSILAILIVVLGLTLFLGYRMNGPASAAPDEAAETKTSQNPPHASDARINLDLVAKGEDSEDTVGRRNVFTYREAPPPPPPGSRSGGPMPPSPPAPVATQPIPSQPVAPPPPPTIPLQYQGFLVNRSPGGGMIAVLAEGTARHYNVTVGEVLMGRYRVTRISETSVEVEDLEYNRRQTLPVIK